MKYDVTAQFKLAVEPDKNQTIVDLGAIVLLRVDAVTMAEAKSKALVYLSSTYPQRLYDMFSITSEVING